jgi:hypothetical protein
VAGHVGEQLYTNANVNCHKTGNLKKGGIKKTPKADISDDLLLMAIKKPQVNIRCTNPDWGGPHFDIYCPLHRANSSLRKSG